MAILLASILDADWLKLTEEIQAVDSAGIDGFSIDIMDGNFVPRITFGPHIVSQIRNITDLPIEAHLMIANPDEQIKNYCDAGADQILFHLEASKNPVAMIDYIHSRGLLAGLAILIETDLDAVSDEILEKIDALNLMAVRVGYGGQKPAENTIERIIALRERAKILNPNLVIEIDGGMKQDNCGNYVNAGADIIVIGTGIYKASDYSEAIAAAKANMNFDASLSKKRLNSFLSTPSVKLIDDSERRSRLDIMRQEMGISKTSWNPLESKR